VNALFRVYRFVLIPTLTAALYSTAAAFPCPEKQNLGSFLNQIFLPAQKQNGPKALLSKVDYLYWKAERTNRLLNSSSELNLGNRFLKGDRHPVMLAEMGSKVVTEGKRTFLRYPNLSEFVKSYHRKIEEHIAAGRLTKEDALFPAVTFKNIKTGELRFIKLGEEGLNSTEWELVQAGDAISHQEWGRALSQGKVPFDPKLYDHDFSHLTEYIENPRKMAEIKNYYTRLTRGEVHADETGILSRKNLPHSDEKKLFYRVNAVDEGYSLPDLSQTRAIQERIPFVFKSPSSKTLGAHRNYLKELAKTEPRKFQNRLELMKKECDQSLLRMGGVARDTDHLHQFALNRMEFDWSKLGTESYAQVRVLSDSVSFKDLFKEIGHSSLYAIEKTLKIYENPAKISQIAKMIHLSPELTKERLNQYLAHELAQLEVVYRNALELRITPERLVSEGTQQLVSPNTATYHYFEATTDAGSLLHWAFIR
jgi:hypothetical protein